MSNALRIGSTALRQPQRGVSLVVVLVLLVVMSILGIAVLRSSAMQERMSANLVDRNEAMQAAETGLLEAQENVIRGTFNAMWNGSSDFTTLRGTMTCAADGLCDRSDPNVGAKWETAPTTPTNWVHMDPNDTDTPRYGYTVEYLGTAKGESSEVQGVCNTTSAPRYLCERPMFRVTAYGRGRGVAQVVLQANILSQPQ
jgi:type IV pilus assembly protein PilX